MPSLTQNIQSSSRVILLPEFLGPPWYPHEVLGPLKPGMIPQSGVTGSCELIVIRVSEGQVISVLNFLWLTRSSTRGQELGMQLLILSKTCF